MGNCFSGDKKKSWGLQRDEHTNVSFNPYQTNTELEGVFSSTLMLMYSLYVRKHLDFF